MKKKKFVIHVKERIDEQHVRLLRSEPAGESRYAAKKRLRHVEDGITEENQFAEIVELK